MGQTALKGFWARGAAVSLAWVLVWALLGPSFDHHFAERQLDHAHAYSAQLDVDHSHPYQSPHPHDASNQGSAPSKIVRDTREGGGIVYLSTYRGSGHLIESSLSLAYKSAAIFPYLGNSFIFLRTLPESNDLKEAFVAPPKKPPTV